MRTPLIGALSLGLWLASIPVIAQTPNPPQGTEKKSTGKPPQIVAPTPPPAQQAPAAGAGELSHQAMVEEQERRDREAEAERDRDDQ